MKTKLHANPAHAPLPQDNLFDIQMKVARRADVLARQSHQNNGGDMAHWLQAEREVLMSQLPILCAN
jgi:hypothetical protein